MLFNAIICTLDLWRCKVKEGWLKRGLREASLEYANYRAFRRCKMVQLNKHAILWEAFEVVQAIDKCEASELLTQAVIKASKLMDNIELLVDENIELKKELAERSEK